MESFSEILKYILPSLVVLATTWILLRLYLSHEKEVKQSMQKVEIQKAVLPVRLQAYERLMLLMERLQPAGLLLRISSPGMNARDLQAALLQAVRDEFEHNLSQQLYVSRTAWEKVKNAREETIRQVNSAMTMISPESGAAELAQAILVKDMDETHSLLLEAIDSLKKEAAESFF